MQLSPTPAASTPPPMSCIWDGHHEPGEDPDFLKKKCSITEASGAKKNSLAQLYGREPQMLPQEAAVTAGSAIWLGFAKKKGKALQQFL